MSAPDRITDHPASRPGTSQKLRSACDACHRAKVRCDGAATCSRCIRDNVECRYSYRAHIGKPKGTLNKKTIERMRSQGCPPPAPVRAARGASSKPDSSSHNPGLQFDSPHSGSESSILSPPPPPIEVDPFVNMADMSAVDGLIDLSVLDSNCIFSYPGSDCDDVANHFLKRNGCADGSQIPTRASPHRGEQADAQSAPPTDGVGEEMGMQAPGFCFCVGVLTGHTQHLHDTWRSRGAAVRLDRALECVQRTSAALAGVVQCPSCPSNVGVLLLLIVALSMTLDQILPAALSSAGGGDGSNPHRHHYPIEIRVGTMDVSGHLGDAIQNLVAHSQLTCLRGWLDRFETKLSGYGFDDFNQAQVAFACSEARRFKGVLEKSIQGILGPGKTSL